jgi:hypothetical protein
MGHFSVDALAGVEAFDRLLADGLGEGARSADFTIGTETKSWLRTTIEIRGLGLAPNNWGPIRPLLAWAESDGAFRATACHSSNSRSLVPHATTKRG